MSRGGSTYYYHHDGLGSVTDLTTASGTVVESYNYDVYGAPSQTSSVGNPYLFTGRRLDSESGIYYYRARMYSPTIGRFLQRDPLGYVDSPSPYLALLNNPVRFVDKNGKEAVDYIVTLGLIAYGAYQGYVFVRNYFNRVLMQLNNGNGFTKSQMEDMIQDALVPPFIPDLTPHPENSSQNQNSQPPSAEEFKPPAENQSQICN